MEGSKSNPKKKAGRDTTTVGLILSYSSGSSPERASKYPYPVAMTMVNTQEELIFALYSTPCPVGEIRATARRSRCRSGVRSEGWGMTCTACGFAAHSVKL